MPQHLIKRILPSLDQIYPPFLQSLLELLATLESQGTLYCAISGYRSKSEQAKLYFQGRTTPGPIVTNAKPGFSYHNYGLAVDVARDLDVLKAGLQPGWATRDYAPLAVEGEKLGLQVGVKGLNDPGHIQYVHDADNKGLLAKLHAAPDLRSAWKIIDGLPPRAPKPTGVS